ncbi:MAG: HD domain-containing phosphohydrolase [Acidobacteriota bacterium]
MREYLKLSMNNLITALSNALDLYKSELLISSHHKRVTIIALKIAEYFRLSDGQRNDLFFSAILHDLGISTHKEKISMYQFEFKIPEPHCIRGYELINSTRILKPYSKFILYHHDRWDGKNKSGLKGNKIPLESQIIHLSDRIEILINYDSYVLEQKNSIRKKIKNYSEKLFNPELVDSFIKISEQDSFWFDLASPYLDDILSQLSSESKIIIGLKDLKEIALTFAKIVDDKSEFTKRHSEKIGKTARIIASKLGSSQLECELIEIAGLLHDLGKLSIPDEILDKPSGLTEQEFNIMKKHSYYTYHILGKIEGFEQMKEWAAFHHEKLNGAGYPFKKDKTNLSLFSKIMAVSDIFNALTEERPYRKALDKNDVFKIMDEKVKKEEIDGNIVNVLKNNYEEIISKIKRS